MALNLESDPALGAVAERSARAGRTNAGVTAALWLGCVVIATGFIWRVNAHSLIGYWYYFAVWLTFTALFDWREVKDFVTAYFITAVFTALYVMVQVHYYPESYGCTSPLGAQTDDSFFFSLVADSIPPGMDTRDGYYLYSYGFSSLVRGVTPFSVTHPLDVLFFLSGVAGMVCVYARQLTILLTSNRHAGRTAYVLALFCPMMLMNGGAVFVRDTMVAGLLLLSFCCLFRRRYLAFGMCVVMQFILRPGTAVMILAIYGFMFAENLGVLLRTKKNRLRVGLAVAILGGVGAGVLYSQQEQLMRLFEDNGVVVTELRREGQSDILAAGFGKGAFTAIQQQVLPLRLLLSTAYMYLAPFFNPNGMVTSDAFDTRILLMNVVYPLWALPIHAWAVAALFPKDPWMRKALRKWLLMILVACFFIGVFSLQIRHRVIIQPLFYALAAAGLHLGSKEGKVIGFCLAGLWIVFQLAYLLFF